MLGNFCGVDGPGTWTSSTNALYVRFVTDGSESGTGFTLNYQAVNRKRNFRVASCCTNVAYVS